MLIAWQQMRSVPELEQRMRMLASEGELGRGPADAFLCVSGSHPVRRLPLANRSACWINCILLKLISMVAPACAASNSNEWGVYGTVQRTFRQLRVAQTGDRA